MNQQTPKDNDVVDRILHERREKQLDLARRLPLIEHELRATGLFATANIFNRAVRAIGYEISGDNKGLSAAMDGSDHANE